MKAQGIQQSFLVDEDIALPYHEVFHINGRRYELVLEAYEEPTELFKGHFDISANNSGYSGPLRHNTSYSAWIPRLKEWAIGDERYNRLGRYTEE